MELTSLVDQYLSNRLQMEHACALLLNSELFAFHSERMCDNLVEDVQNVCTSFSPFQPLTDPL